MTGTIAVLPCPDSSLRRLDPRWKLVALLLAAVAVAWLQTLPVALTALAGSAVLAVMGQLPCRWILRRLGSIALLLAPFLILLPLLHAGGAAWQVGSVAFALEGCRNALLLICKTLALVLLVLVLLTSAPLQETLKAAQALRVPGVLIQLTLLTYRYIFVLADELARLRLALRVRGYRNRPTLHSYRTVGHVAGLLLVRGAERAERVGQAMRCRGFDGQFRSLESFQTRSGDVLFFGLTTTVAVTLTMADWMLRWAW